MLSEIIIQFIIQKLLRYSQNVIYLKITQEFVLIYSQKYYYFIFYSINTLVQIYYQYFILKTLAVGPKMYSTLKYIYIFPLYSQNITDNIIIYLFYFIFYFIL